MAVAQQPAVFSNASLIRVTVFLDGVGPGRQQLQFLMVARDRFAEGFLRVPL
jgi:hypothetical protein